MGEAVAVDGAVQLGAVVIGGLNILKAQGGAAVRQRNAGGRGSKLRIFGAIVLHQDAVKGIVVQRRKSFRQRILRRAVAARHHDGVVLAAIFVQCKAAAIALGTPVGRGNNVMRIRRRDLIGSGQAGDYNGIAGAFIFAADLAVIGSGHGSVVIGVGGGRCRSRTALLPASARPKEMRKIFL